ncbi:MAG: ATP-binding protein [Pirellula sp.]|nr:ATP-binding protein [Pirellula sp.]
MAFYPVADIPDEARAECDNIAYELTGAVQNHSALIVLDRVSLRVLQVSNSISEILGVRPSELLSMEFSFTLLGSASPDVLPWPMLQEENSQEAIVRFLNRTGKRFLVRAHSLGNRILVSIEPESLAFDIHLNDADNSLADLLIRLGETESVEVAAGVLAESLRSTLGFDRSIVYRFDSQWNGQVIAESLVNPELEPFLGLKFPASDIPKSARRLYTEARLRHVVDVQSVPSKIEPELDPLTGKYTNLSRLVTRSSAASCREYYGNMKIRSTCVIPILVSGRTWGHVSCFHSEPARIPIVFETKLYAAAQAFAQRAAAIEFKHRMDAESKAMLIQQELALRDSEKYETPESLHRPIESLMTLLRSEHASLLLEQERIETGLSIASSSIRELLSEIRDKASSGFFCTDRLKQALPTLEGKLEGFAGVLAIAFDADWNEAFVLLRRERSESGLWAGDPREGLRWNQEGKPSMRPRASFAAYLAHSKDSSPEWTEDELHIAQTCTQVIGLQLMRMKAQAARKSQEAFLANMSHEIRTPMTAVLGYIDILNEYELDRQDAKDAVETIRRNGEHLLAVINDILDFSKLHSNLLSVEMRSFSLSDLLADIIESFMALAVRQGTSLSCTLSENVPVQVVSDPVRFRQIVVNLVGNAIKFSKGGEVCVWIDYRSDDAVIVAEVRDSGIGMTPTQLNAIREFQPFRQADVSVTRKFGGSGLGLAISKSLVELLGGSISVESELGKGTTFRFCLVDQNDFETKPIDQSPNLNVIDSASKSVRTENSRMLSGARILLAEDGPDNQRLLKFILSREGAEVTVCENGQQVLELLDDDSSFHLILMDMQMPVLDGYSATRRLRELNIETPIIGLSAHAHSGAEEIAMESGCDAYCTKPVDRQQIIRVCAKWLEKARLAKR